MSKPLPSQRQRATGLIPGAEDEPSGLDLGELAHFFSRSHDLLTILDGRGRVLLASPSVERILGYPPEDMVGQPLLDLVHQDDMPGVREHVRELLREPDVRDLDCRVRHADGRWLSMRWSVSTQAPKGRIYAVGRDRSGELRRSDEARSRETAELRLRTASELHDGVLQTLTAAGLQLEVARRMVRTNPEATEEVLAKLGESFSAEQRELRLYVDELSLEEPLWADRRIPLGERLADMLDRIQAIWGVRTSLDAKVGDNFDPEFERRVLRIIQEAVVNAARHGGAEHVRIRVESGAETVLIGLSDDGHGFPFFGNYEDQDLKDKRLGPVSLKRRVGQGGGTIAIQSTQKGAMLQISLPTPRRSP